MAQKKSETQKKYVEMSKAELEQELVKLKAEYKKYQSL